MRRGDAGTAQFQQFTGLSFQIAQVELVLGIKTDMAVGLAAAKQTIRANQFVQRQVFDDQVVAVRVVSVRIVAFVVRRD